MVSVVTTKVKEVSAYDRHSNEAHSSKHLQTIIDPGGDVELKYVHRTHSFKNEAVYGATIL